MVSLESAAFLGFLMPGEALVFLGGCLASQGVLDLKLLIPLVAAAAILGDSIGYELGRLLQKAWFLRYGRWLGLREEHWQRIEDFFQRHGGKTVFLARFSAFFRILVPFFAGAARLNYFHFLRFNVLGGVIWAAGSVSIGYLAGESWRAIEHWIGRSALIAAILVVAVILVVRLVRRSEARCGRTRWRKGGPMLRVLRNIRWETVGLVALPCPLFFSASPEGRPAAVRGGGSRRLAWPGCPTWPRSAGRGRRSPQAARPRRRRACCGT